jgi:epsilon-lactone hydrolase
MNTPERSRAGSPAPDWLVERRALIDQQLEGVPIAEGVVVEPLSGSPVPGLSCAVPRSDAAPPPITILYLHGGGYRMGSAMAYRAYGSRLASAAGAEVVLPDYRLAPEHPFPAAVDDALSVYRWMLDDRALDPRSVVVAGDSAGAGLSLALLIASRDTGLPLPAVAIAISPWCDLFNAGASFETNAELDQVFSLTAASEAADTYLQGADPAEPLASPARADLSGLPAIHVMVGGNEVLLDDARSLVDAALAAGVDATLSVHPGQSHVWHLNMPVDEAAATAMDEISAVVRRWTTCA